MQFKNKVQAQFKKAGWFPGRDVSNTFTNSQFVSFPLQAQIFLKEYGGLKVEDCKNYESDVTNIFDTGLNTVGTKTILNYPFSNNLFIIGYCYPDHYLVCTDIDGAIYLVGDYYFKRSENFINGIEKIIEDDWDGCKEWNFETNEWVDEY